MSYIDIVNEEDEVIGKAPRKDIYQKKLLHRIVHVLIFNDKEKLLLQLRSKDCSFCPLHWYASAGGHVDSGESYLEAALRETKEELGIDVNLELLSEDLYEDTEYTIGLRKFLNTFKTSHNGPFVVNPKEVELTKFVSLERVQEMINSGEKFHPETLFLLKKHFDIK